MIVTLLYTLSLSLRLDNVQNKIAATVSEEIEHILGIPAQAEMLRIKDLDEIILKNILLLDQQNDTILAAKEITAHISPLELFKERIQINTLTVAAPDIRISRLSKNDELNIQFIIDKLKQEEAPDKKKFSVHINQLIVYDGMFRYDIHDTPKDKTKFDPAHIAVSGISLNVSLRKFLKDELDLLVRSIKGREQSGLCLNKLKARIKAVDGEILLKSIELELPESRISSDSINVRYDRSTAKALEFEAHIKGDKVTPADFAALHPDIAKRIPPLAFIIDSHSDSLSAHTALLARSTDNSI